MMLARPAVAGDEAAIAALLQRGALSHVGVPGDPAATVADQQWLVEDTRSGRTLATARLVAAVGLSQPFATYHVGCVVHASTELRLFHRLRTLYLGHDHTGATELTDIAVETDDVSVAERSSALSLLVQSLLLWIAQHRARYAPLLVAALPGVVDAAGRSPFWQGLGRQFFDVDLADALRMHGPAWKAHAAALMPRHPLYAAFLPASAQAAIAQPHPRAAALLDVLEHEGLRYAHHIDLADGGPLLEAAPEDLRTVATSRLTALEPVEALPAEAATVPMLMVQDRPQAMRLRGMWSAAGRLQVTQADVRRLGIDSGLPVRVAEPS